MGLYYISSFILLLIIKKKESVPMLKYIFADMGNTTKYLDSTISHLFDKQHRCYTE